MEWPRSVTVLHLHFLEKHLSLRRLSTCEVEGSQHISSTMPLTSRFLVQFDYRIHSFIHPHPYPTPEPVTCTNYIPFANPFTSPSLKPPTPQHPAQHPPPHLPHPPHPLLPPSLPLPHLLTPLHLPRIPIYTTLLTPPLPHKLPFLPPARRPLRPR